MPLICVTRNYTINTLCWCCHLFFSHWSAALMIKGRLLEVKAISYSIPITDDPEFKSSSRDCTHLLYRSYQMWPLRYCGGFSDINMAVPPDICVTSFVTGDFLPPPTPNRHTHSNICAAWAGLCWLCKFENLHCDFKASEKCVSFLSVFLSLKISNDN